VEAPKIGVGATQSRLNCIDYCERVDGRAVWRGASLGVPAC
jgi:hypothetical protein